ncbi:unnamed protein product [Schistosoma margrebowiei]|uniref:Uncharacterized protein n=1 Tax=Schistosoma margrebowiei TaxID=48269 RepID=A0A183MTC7_9TREM|nr:unnamed protein product [Schistosoma margrebowiei]
MTCFVKVDTNDGICFLPQNEGLAALDSYSKATS